MKLLAPHSGISLHGKIKPKALFKLRYQTAKKFQIPCPSNIALLNTYQKLIKAKKIKPNAFLEKQLRTRPIRNLSGVAVIAVLTKPHPCPGNCLFCPTQKNIPKSYLKNEPAVMRAVLNNFDPYRQVKHRIKALHLNGHNTEKIELIIIGGTFSALSKSYQTRFIKRCLDAMNNKTAKNLEEAKKLNERASNRCVGITIETRPDWIDLKEIKNLRRLGVTRVELGVQSIDNKILDYNCRNHTVEDTIKATQLLKDAGFKICYHLMLNLPRSNPEKDFLTFKTVFTDPRFQPDQIKLYPCVVVKESNLYKFWREGKYHSYSQKETTELIVKIKKIVPSYMRIVRLIRDIPTTEIESGNMVSNLRQLLKEQGVKCQCTRCREAREKTINPKDLVYSKIEYPTLGGKEMFLQYTSKDKQTLFAFLRLRLPVWKNSEFLKSLKGMALLRELHTYGQLASIGKSAKYTQHQGLGKKLLIKAEKISRENNYSKMAVIAGIGVREYYRRLGYKEMNDNEYLVKNI